MSYELIGYSDYLEHYGIKGQKWGVRRFQNEDGTLTAAGKEHYGLSNGGSGNEKLAGRYAREAKKLKKLSDKADVNIQRSRAEKLEKQSKTAKRVGNTAAAAVLPALGVSVLSDSNNRAAIRKLNNDINSVAYIRSNGAKMRTDTPFDAVNWISPEKAHKINLATFYSPLGDSNFAAPRKGDKTAGAVAKAVAIGAGATAVGAYTTAAVSKVMAKAAKRRTTDIGHAKAVQKCQKQIDKMTKMFADTPYADLINKK